MKLTNGIKELLSILKKLMLHLGMYRRISAVTVTKFKPQPFWVLKIIVLSFILTKESVGAVMIKELLRRI